MSTQAPGFLEPDAAFAALPAAELASRLEISYHQAIQAPVERFLGQDVGFDRIIERHKVLTPSAPCCASRRQFLRRRPPHRASVPGCWLP
jgi:hypothetical protein